MSDTPRTDFVAHAKAWANGAKDKIVQLERELAEAKEQLRLCNVDQFTTAAELAEAKRNYMDFDGGYAEGFSRYLERELAKAIAKERERCAKVCEEFYSVENIAQKCAAAIRKGE